MPIYNTKMLNDVQKNMQSDYAKESLSSWRYYKADKKYLPVFNRPDVSPLKAATRVNTHAQFMKSIIEQKVGYVGQAYTTLFNSDEMSDSLYDDMNMFIKQFESMNDFDTSSPETIRWTSAMGLSHRLLYFKDGQPRIKNYKGFQVAYVGDMWEPQEALIFWTEGGKDRATVYNQFYKSEYYKHNNSWTVIKDDSGEVEISHGFTSVPVIPFVNNEEMESDCDAIVRHNIDTYDSTLSDVLSEIKATRLAYLKIYGQIQTGYYLDAEGNPILDSNGNKIPIPINEWIANNGTMIFGIDDDGKPVGNAEYLTKQMQDEVIEHNLDRLREQIFMDSAGVDKRFITQGSNQRVLAINSAYDEFYKKCETFEKYMSKSLKMIWEIMINSFYFMPVSEGGIYPLTEDEKHSILENLQFHYENNAIRDDLESAKLLQMYQQTLPLKLALEKAGIENAEEVAQQMKDERLEVNPYLIGEVDAIT